VDLPRALRHLVRPRRTAGPTDRRAAHSPGGRRGRPVRGGHVSRRPSARKRRSTGARRSAPSSPTRR
jgi:hypothetical protein